MRTRTRAETLSTWHFHGRKARKSLGENICTRTRRSGLEAALARGSSHFLAISRAGRCRPPTLAMLPACYGVGNGAGDDDVCLAINSFRCGSRDGKIYRGYYSPVPGWRCGGLHLDVWVWFLKRDVRVYEGARRRILKRSECKGRGHLALELVFWAKVPRQSASANEPLKLLTPCFARQDRCAYASQFGAALFPDETRLYLRIGPRRGLWSARSLLPRFIGTRRN